MNSNFINQSCFKPFFKLYKMHNYQFWRAWVELTLKLVEEEMAFEYFFGFVSGGNAVGSLLISLLLREMILIAVSYHGRKGSRGSRGEAPRKFFRPSLFHVKKTPFLKREGTEKALSFLC